MSADVLTDVLQTIRLENAVYGRMLLGAPWGLRFDPQPRLGGFLVVARGGGWLEADGVERPIALAPGDFVFHHGRHGMSLRDHARTRAVPVHELFHGCPSGGVARAGGDGPTTELIAGCFTWADDPSSNPLIAALPPLVHVRGEAGRLDPVLQLLSAEVGAAQPGARTVISRLADVMLVMALRAHLAGLQGSCKEGGWLRAVVDPQIGAVLAAIHDKPQAPWSVESLAQTAAMSRSAFAARFAELVGVPPLHYVTRWRMQKAAHALRTSEARLAEIASSVGYETEAAFSKAFKRIYQQSPGAFRRAA
jgi:AraC-like DNA-binding protein